MTYRTFTDDTGDEFRFYYYVNDDGDDVTRVEYKRSGYSSFEVIFEGIMKYIVPNQFE